MTTSEPVLVVDDEREVRDTLASALGQGGFQVLTVRDATEALEALHTREYPVVLTDLHMPGRSGLDLLSEIRARHPDTLCVVITGYASLETATESLKRGAYDFIQKPFKLGQVEATLNRALEFYRSRKQLSDYQHRLEEMVVARTGELRSFHEEVVALNELLIAVQGHTTREGRAMPFLEHFSARYAPDELALVVPDAGGWALAASLGPRTWTIEELAPRLPRLSDVVHLTAGLGQLEEAFLLPLRHGDRLLGAVVVGFRKRSAFQPRDKSVDHWRRGLEAALLGWIHAHGSD